MIQFELKNEKQQKREDNYGIPRFSIGKRLD